MVPVINSVLDSVKFDVVVYSLDWHPSDHISFVTNVTKFPMHSSSKVGLVGTRASRVRRSTVGFSGLAVNATSRNLCLLLLCLVESWVIIG